MSTMQKFAAILLLSLASLSAQVQAATVGLGYGDFYTSTLANNLTAQGHTVTLVNSYDQATLAGFDVYIQDGNSYFNGAALGQFVAGGGLLIELPWSFTHVTLPEEMTVMSGRIEPIFAEPNPAITALLPADDLLAGVTLPAAGQYVIGRELGNAFMPDATAVLEWADGTALLGYRHYGAGTVMAFNLHMITSDATPLDAVWSNQILYNAIGPVPEPATVVMLCGGLAIVAVVSIRRRSRRGSNAGKY